MFNKFDLAFVGLDIYSIILPKNKRFLMHYFKGQIELVFLNYYYYFQSTKNFIDHTGIVLSKKKLGDLKKLYHFLLYCKQKSAKDMDLEFLGNLELGKLSPQEINRKYNLSEFIDY